MAWQIQLGKQVHAALMYFSFCVQIVCVQATSNINYSKNHKNALKTILRTRVQVRVEMSTRLENAHAQFSKII